MLNRERNQSNTEDLKEKISRAIGNPGELFYAADNLVFTRFESGHIGVIIPSDNTFFKMAEETWISLLAAMTPDGSTKTNCALAASFQDGTLTEHKCCVDLEITKSPASSIASPKSVENDEKPKRTPRKTTTRKKST